MKVWQKNLILIVLVVLLAALPLWLLPAIRRRYGSTVARIPSLLRCNAL